MNPPEEFGVFLNFHARSADWFNFSYGQAPFRRDVVLIPAAEPGGLYPKQGPHEIELYPGGRTAYYALYLARLQALVVNWIPHANYDGLIVFDYEFFSPWWTGHLNMPSTEGIHAYDFDPIDDWRETLRITRAGALAGLNAQQQEAYFKQEWEATTREFFERTFNAVRSIRPLAKLGFYNQPAQTYWDWRDPVKAAAMRAGHDSVPWFWSMVDVILTSTYSFYPSVADHRTPGPYQDRESDFDFYVRTSITEGLRVANGKPIYNYVSFQYHLSNPFYSMDPVSDFNMRHPLNVSRELGCNGVIIWGEITSQHQYNQISQYFPTLFSPYITRFAYLPAYAPANPARPRRVE